MQVKPRIYQKLAIKSAVTGLRENLRALIVLATGLGKTLTSAFVAEAFGAKRILFLVHNNFILEHAVEEYSLVFSETEYKKVTYNGFSKEGAYEADIVFATWQTMGKNLTKWSRDHFDLVIVDEAHHTEADTYRPVADYFTGPKLGITATPDRYDNSDIREVFGPEVIDISLEEAISRGWLPKIEYHVMLDETLNDKVLQEITKEIREGKKRLTMAEVNRRLFIRKRDEEIARIINERSERAIVFCTTISHADRMAKALNHSDTFHSKRGQGNKDTWKKNQAVLSNLRSGDLRRVCAVNAFNEGVNVPSIGLVAFCRSTESYTIFKQQLGRGAHSDKDKIIVFDFVGNLERIQLVIDMMNKISDLHEKHTSREDLEKERYVRSSFEVSGHGFEFTFSDKIADLVSIREHCEKDFYPTWQEASIAAMRLDIKAMREYNEQHKEDRGLPGRPDRYYKNFPNWVEFLGGVKKDFYPTWQEASIAAKKLGVKDSRSYKEKYKNDVQLPGRPDLYYQDFPSFVEFFGGVKKEFYLTWQEASTAAKKLGIKSSGEYKLRYREENNLPSNPNAVYRNFPTWTKFLNTEKYTTWQEASVAAIRLGFRSSTEYSQGYRNDKYLPSVPHKFYQDFPTWFEFLGTEKYKNWQDASIAARRLGIKTGVEYKKRYKEDVRLPIDPREFYKAQGCPGWNKFLGKS